MGRFFTVRCLSLFFFFFFGEAVEVAGSIWSREEMVELAGYGEQKLSSVVITGSLLCETSLSHPRPHHLSTAIPGATVAIKCHNGFKRRTKWIKAVTDDLGEFVIDLPSELHAILDLEKTCFVNPIHVPRPYRCYQTSINTQKDIKLVSSTNGFRVYTSGKIRLHGYRSKLLQAHASASNR